MNRIFFSILLLIAGFTGDSIFAQDTLVARDGKQFIVKIISISYDRIKYRNLKYPDHILTAMANQVAIIKYRDGTSDSLDYIKDKTSAMAQKGKRDARKYYDDYGGAVTCTAITTILAGGIGGLIPAIACSSTPPALDRLNMPDSSLAANSHYKSAYEREAHHIKSRKVWISFALGVTFDVALAIFLRH